MGPRPQSANCAAQLMLKATMVWWAGPVFSKPIVIKKCGDILRRTNAPNSIIQ